MPRHTGHAPRLARHTGLPTGDTRLARHTGLPTADTRLTGNAGLPCGRPRLTGRTRLPRGDTRLARHTRLPPSDTRLTRGSLLTAARTSLTGRRTRLGALLAGHSRPASHGTRRVGQSLRRNPGGGVGSTLPRPLREHSPDSVGPSSAIGLPRPALHGFDPRDPPLIHCSAAVRIDVGHAQPVGNLHNRRSPDTVLSRSTLGIRLTGDSPHNTDPNGPPVRIRTDKGPRSGGGPP
ncbi:hypothetical protein E1286_19660 [Nonomuraea terrae]|uniref:Uncharacterized protein n=1 Tax=Nonomuraea terrae TaxID=2530383 RepID=A0A4R4YNZ9_9ACTN|nr:hypothetical protein [Nonomuraea terrae]TDD46845.1 hypothetical protein E1286_19660 [Nonomuraea terrae]